MVPTQGGVSFPLECGLFYCLLLLPGIMSDQQGCSQEFSFTEARLKGKGALNAGGLGVCTPQKLMQYIKVTFSILLNSYV